MWAVFGKSRGVGGSYEKSLPWGGYGYFLEPHFQICCTDMCLVEFLANFAVFHVFLSISRDFADIPEFRGSATARNFRSPAKMDFWEHRAATIT